jgi:hypothetical protein
MDISLAPLGTTGQENGKELERREREEREKRERGDGPG